MSDLPAHNAGDDPPPDAQSGCSATGALRPVPLSGWSKSKYIRISPLLDAALELAPEARAAWLDALESRDPEAAADLRDLLGPTDDRAARILSGCDDLAERLAALSEAENSLVGRRFGPYCVRSLLGSGGMGSVWLAERVDGAFTRRVALKLVHPALVGRGLGDRLSRECAILASLDHPNIARLYDAGISDQGQPYLALEYVAGMSLGGYCDTHRLGVRQRLELFQQILGAVLYAHAHLVIHRDLKPSNILVTEAGRVCLLDFGIATLLSDGVAKETELTQLGGRALSLDFAAPEQIAGAPVTVAADIYSLGVMLYELLSGQLPYRFARRSRAALEEAILWTEPVPMGRLAIDQAAASARATTVGRLTQILRGDLDAIAAKALQKSPGERYATVDGLREDIARWLRNEPVLARRDSLPYRAVKFVRRHFVAVAVTGAFILTLLGGLVATSYEAKLAAEQRDTALRAQLALLTQAAAARLKDGDVSAALGIIVEVLQREMAEGANTSDALAVFQEARATDSQVLALVADPGAHIEWTESAEDAEASGSVEFSPDGRRLLTALGPALRIWDAATGHVALVLQNDGARLDKALFSPDGGSILTLSGDNTPQLRSADTGRVILELKGHTDRVKSAAFSDDGRRLLTTSEDRTARIWDASTGRELVRLTHRDKVCGAGFSPDGQHVITGSHDKIARVWDAVTGRELFRLSGHLESVRAVAFSHDAQHIVTASDDRTVRLWDASNGRLISPLTGHTGVVSDASFSPDDRHIATAAADRTARIWDALYGRQTEVLVHPDLVWGAAFAPDSRSLATTSRDGVARIWDVSPDRQSLLIMRSPEQVFCAAFSPDGSRILTASSDGTAGVRDARMGQGLVTLRGHTDRVWCAAFSPDGRRVITGSRDRTARVWDASDGRELLRLSGHAEGIASVAFSPDGRHLATGSYDKTARVWDAVSGRELLRLEGHTDNVNFVAFSPDSRRLITASSDKTARIWDVISGRELLRIRGHTAGVNSAIFSGDGQRVLTASDDRTARIWDAATGREQMKFTGHRDLIGDAQFSPDGRLVVTASRDRSVRVWETTTGRSLMLYKGHDDEIFTAAFSPDGARIISASADRTARVWDAQIPSLEEQLAWVEAARFDPLSASQRVDLGLLPAPGAPASLGQPSSVESREPSALARLAEQADQAALVTRTAGERNAHLLEAFRYFAAAAARARNEGWADDASWQWRYRSASLARLLARGGMMRQVAQTYTRVRAESTPRVTTPRG